MLCVLEYWQFFFRLFLFQDIETRQLNLQDNGRYEKAPSALVSDTGVTAIEVETDARQKKEQTR